MTDIYYLVIYCLKILRPIRMSHWRCRSTEGAEFWISWKRLKLLRKAGGLQLIQNSALSVAQWHQCDIRLKSIQKNCQNAPVIPLDSLIFCSALVTTIEVTKMSGKMPWRKMFLVITIIILQLLGKLMGLWRLHTTNWRRDNGFSQGPGFTVHNVGFDDFLSGFIVH